MSESFNLCWHGPLEEALEAHFRKEVVEAIEKAREDYILNVGDEEYVRHLLSKVQVENVEIYPDRIHATEAEEMVAGRLHPFEYCVEPGESYRRTVYTFRLPFTGDAGLLRLRPNPSVMNTVRLFIVNGHLCWKKIDFGDTAAIKRDADENVALIRRQIDHVRANVGAFNKSLPARIQESVRARRDRVHSRQKRSAGLGIPVVRHPDAAKAYAVPVPVRRSPSLPPLAPLAGGPLHPTLGDVAYAQILGDLGRAGQQMERTPATYQRRDEEGLRDQFLLVLQALYTASATGETYNKSGKTDILLRHEGKNVFIAECKFWRGEITLLEAVDQLLGYLTWRDSKAAILLFVDNKNISAVLAQIEAVLKKHARFVRTEGRLSEGEFRAAFHLEGDPGTHVRVALLAFHFPS